MRKRAPKDEAVGRGAHQRGPNPVAPKKKKYLCKQRDAPCPASFPKRFSFVPGANHSITPAIPFLPKRGARDRHERWERDAMDADARWTKRAASDGEAVWS